VQTLKVSRAHAAQRTFSPSSTAFTPEIKKCTSTARARCSRRGIHTEKTWRGEKTDCPALLEERRLRARAAAAPLRRKTGRPAPPAALPYGRGRRPRRLEARFVFLNVFARLAGFGRGGFQRVG